MKSTSKSILGYRQLEQARANFLRASGRRYNHMDPRASLLNKVIMHMLCGSDDTEARLMDAVQDVTTWHDEGEDAS